MDKPIKVIKGKYGQIHVYRTEKQATKEEFQSLLRFMLDALARREDKKLS